MCFFLPFMCAFLHIFQIGLFDLAITLIYTASIFNYLKVKNVL